MKGPHRATPTGEEQVAAAAVEELRANPHSFHQSTFETYEEIHNEES